MTNKIKLNIKLFLSSVLIVFSVLVNRPSSAFADVQTIRDSDNAVWGSVGTSFLNYKEPSGPPYLPDSEHGWMPSVAGGVSLLENAGNGVINNMYLALETAGSWGTANYNGAFLNAPSTPVQGTTNETIWTFDGKLGHAFPLANDLLLTPYVEVGHRYWGRNLGPGQTETYQNFDTLGGLMVQIAPTSRVILSGYGSLGTTLSPQMHTGGYTYDLGSAGVYKLGGKLGFDLTQAVELFTTLDYDTLRFGQSGVAPDGTYEPNSKTEETMWRVGMAYHFR